MDSTDKQSQLNQVIVLLSKKFYKDVEIEQFASRELSSIYTDNFRHSYSQIFATIETQIRLEGDSANIVECLSENFNLLYKVVNSKSSNLTDEAKSKINKLLDHVMLEVARIGYFNSNALKPQSVESNDTDNKVQELNQKVQEINRKVTKSLGELRTSTNKMDSLRTESVTVLSILAAIMLAGMGGFTILGNIAQTAKEISSYRFFAITAFLGVILFNVVFMLIYMIARLTDKNIYTICTDNSKQNGADCVTANGCSNNCWGLTRIRKRMPYLFWFNLLAISIIVISLLIEHLVMKYDWLEWLTIVGAIFMLQVALYCGIKDGQIK